MCLLNNDNSGVDHCPYSDGDPTQRHDVGRYPHQAHRNEGDDDRDGNRKSGDYRAGNMPEEYEDDDGNNYEFFNQRMFQRFDRSENQLGPIVNRQHFDAWRQTWMD